MSGDVRISVAVLDDFLKQLFGVVGMTSDNAAVCAAALVETNLWGIDSHGVLRMPIYMQRLAAKVVTANPEMTFGSKGGAFEVMDGDDGMGFVVGKAAMARAIELAGEHKIGAVGVTRSNHFGAAALYAKMAADQGMIGIAMTNVRPNLVVPGGSKPVTGNNPIAIGAPMAGPFPFLLDISMSAVAGGKLLLAAAKNEKMPMDWATDKEGRFTDDPVKGFEGFLLPLGGHKGFGLSLVVDLLCGVITGGAFQFGLNSMYGSPDEPSHTGHMMIVIDPTVAISRDDYLQRVEAFYETIKSSPMWQEDTEMFLPGEIEYRSRLARAETGIPIPATLMQELVELGERYGINAELAAARPLETI